MFDAQGAAILHLCRLILRDLIEAEDVAQQTFLSAYRAPLRGTNPREPPAWLAQIARNECRAPAATEARRRAARGRGRGTMGPRGCGRGARTAPGHRLRDPGASHLPAPGGCAQRPARLSNNEVARAMSLAPGAVEALPLPWSPTRTARVPPQLAGDSRGSWVRTDVLVRLGAQLETPLSAAPAARVVAGVAVAVVAAGAATIEIEHQRRKPRPRVHAAIRDTPVAAPRRSAMSEIIPPRRERPSQAESHGPSGGESRERAWP